MDEVFYTKETGWTEAGIAEQERRRRKMETDLTKLTAEQLLISFAPDSVITKEIRRRLERLEKCEAAARGVLTAFEHTHFNQQAADACPYCPALNAASAALEE